VQETLFDAVRVMGNVADAEAGAVSVATGGVSEETGDVAVITMGVGGTDPGKIQAVIRRIENPKYRSLL